jgi:hypothetical protein
MTLGDMTQALSSVRVRAAFAFVYGGCGRCFWEMDTVSLSSQRSNDFLLKTGWTRDGDATVVMMK